MVSDLDYNILAINRANADEFERIYGMRPKVGDNMLGLLADQPEHQAQVRAGWGTRLPERSSRPSRTTAIRIVSGATTR